MGCLNDHLSNSKGIGRAYAGKQKTKDRERIRAGKKMFRAPIYLDAEDYACVGTPRALMRLSAKPRKNQHNTDTDP